MKSLAQIWERSSPHRPVDIFKSWPMPDQLMGIEVEVELHGQEGVVMPRPNVTYPYWEESSDGSLIHGREYKLVRPMRGDQLAEAIQAFFNGTRIYRSTTSSTHIHMDMMDEECTTTTVQNLILLVFMLETALFAVSSPAREWCGYTNALVTAPDNLLAVLLSDNIDSREQEIRRVCNNNAIGRYYGLNLQALSKYGSVEFRYFPTATSEEELIGWVTLVQAFKKAALSYGPLIHSAPFLVNEEVYQEFLGTFFSRWCDTFYKTVPLHKARENYDKALNINRASVIAQPVKFDRKSIAKNKKLSKFFRIKNAVDLHSVEDVKVVCYNSTIRAPQVSTADNLTILMGSDSIYIKVGNTGYWEPIAGNSAHADRFHVFDLDALRLKMMAALREFVVNPEARAAEVYFGRVETRINTWIERMQRRKTELREEERLTSARIVAVDIESTQGPTVAMSEGEDYVLHMASAEAGERLTAHNIAAAALNQTRRSSILDGQLNEVNTSPPEEYIRWSTRAWNSPPEPEPAPAASEIPSNYSADDDDWRLDSEEVQPDEDVE